MVITSVINGATIRFCYTRLAAITDGGVYPFLVEVGAIVESSTAESGNNSFKLTLAALPFIQFALGNVFVIEDIGVLSTTRLFEGVLTDYVIKNDGIECQLEA